VKKKLRIKLLGVSYYCRILIDNKNEYCEIAFVTGSSDGRIKQGQKSLC